MVAEPVALVALVEPAEIVPLPDVVALVAPAVSWAATLQLHALDLIPRGHDVLVAGIGAWGTTFWPQRLLGRTRNIVVVDGDPAALAAVRPYCARTLAADPGEPDWATRLAGTRFGTVLIGTGLTHLADPLAFLRQARALIAPGGAVIALVPNVAFGETRLGLLAGEFPRAFEPGGCRHFYTRDRLRELFAFAGFDLAEVVPVRETLFGDASPFVPECFPAEVLAALGPAHEADIAYFAVRAVPTSPEAVMRTLFDEQQTLRNVVRNELARAGRSNDAQAQRMAEAEARAERLVAELEEARRALVTQIDLYQRADQNVRRLGKEVEDVGHELAGIKASWFYRLWTRFRPVVEEVAPKLAIRTENWRYETVPDVRR